MSRAKNSETQENVYWHLYRLQGLSYLRFIEVSNKILDDRYVLIGLPDSRCIEEEAEAEPHKCSKSLRTAREKKQSRSETSIRNTRKTA